jgi:hypothetical protein
MSSVIGPYVVDSGVIMWLDAANPRSYPGSGVAWADMSGSGNSGTLTNGPTFGPSLGGKVVLDGTNDYVLTGLTAGSPTDRPLTYLVVFKNNLDAPYRGLIGKSDYQVSGISVANMAISRVMVSLNASGQNFEHQVDYDCSVVSMGTFVFSGRDVRVYRNESLLYSTTISFDPAANSGQVEVGGSIQGGWGYSSMDLHLVLAYSRALSAGEVAQNYSAFGPRFGLL